MTHLQFVIIYYTIAVDLRTLQVGRGQVGVDIDLPFDGIEKVHAIIKRMENQVYILSCGGEVVRRRLDLVPPNLLNPLVIADQPCASPNWETSSVGRW